jgi:hypothetical protein
VRQVPDGFSLGRRERPGLRLHHACLLLLQLPLGGKLLFPCLGELSSDQAMFGLDQAVVAGSPFRLIGRPLQALLPQPVEVPPFLFKARRRLQRKVRAAGSSAVSTQ